MGDVGRESGVRIKGDVEWMGNGVRREVEHGFDYELEVGRR
jgi:hypothetical protein